jgi:hypothetical protein
MEIQCQLNQHQSQQLQQLVVCNKALQRSPAAIMDIRCHIKDLCMELQLEHMH